MLKKRELHFDYADYAITIQQPQIITDGWDVRHLFDGIFSEQETDDVLAKMIAPKRYSFAQHLERRKDIDISNIGKRNYITLLKQSCRGIKLATLML